MAEQAGHEAGGRETASAFADRLRARFEGAEVDVAMSRGEVGIVFAPDAWHNGCRALREEFGSEMLAHLYGTDYLRHCCADWPPEATSEGNSQRIQRKGPGRLQ